MARSKTSEIPAFMELLNNIKSKINDTYCMIERDIILGGTGRFGSRVQ